MELLQNLKKAFRNPVKVLLITTGVLSAIILVCIAMLVGYNKSPDNIKLEVEKATLELTESVNEQSKKLSEVETKILNSEDDISMIERNITTIKSDISVLKNSISYKVSSEQEMPEQSQTSTDLDSSFKEQIKDYVEKDLEGKVTKITFDAESNIFYLAYNSKMYAEDTIKKEIYDIVTNLAENNSDVNIDITSTNDMGNSHHSLTKTEVMVKIKNLEISYTEWLEEAF